MKIALFFVALIAGSLAQSNSNNNCLLGSGAPGSTCATNNQCASGLSCVNGLCNFVNLGQTCSADTQCGGLYPFCIGGRCDAKRIPGDPCSMNEQCISNMCSGTCMARQLNQACGGSDCAPGLFCSPLTRVCTSKIAVGASCSNEYLAMVSNISFAHDLSVMCADSALCDYNPNASTNAGICTPIFSATQGTCGAFGSLTCPVGSTCNQNTCSSGGNNIQCASNAQCGITTFCACSGNSGNTNFQVFTSSNNVATNAGVSRQLAGANVGTQGASANVAGAGANVGTQGVAVGTSQTGAAVGTQGVAVGSGQTGAAVGTQGAAVGTGQTGAAVGTQGAAVGTQGAGVAVGTQGAAVGTQGTGVVVGPNGAIAGQGTTIIVSTNFQGNCQSDRCLNTYAPDYYSCLLQNGCGLSSSPLFINGTCASKCAYLYSRIQCCQAGFQPIVSANTGSNSGSNSNSGLQRSIALPLQVQCVQFSQPPQAVSSAGALESGVVVLAALMAGLVF